MAINTIFPFVFYKSKPTLKTINHENIQKQQIEFDNTNFILYT
jgi:hypothetical protein